MNSKIFSLKNNLFVSLSYDLAAINEGNIFSNERRCFTNSLDLIISIVSKTLLSPVSKENPARAARSEY